MQKNSNNGQKRPVLVEQNHSTSKTKDQQRRKTQQKQTVGQRQMMQESSHQALSMANRRAPSLQERAEQHRREHEKETNEQQRVVKSRTVQSQHKKDVQSPTKTRKKQKSKKTSPKEPGVLDKIFVRGSAAAGAPDFFIMEVVAILLAIGLIMVFSASSYRSLLENGNAYSYFIKQTASAVMGIVVAFAVMMMNPGIFQKLAPVLLILVFFLLLFTLFAGEESLGATRWVTIAGIRFQPSEMAKPLMVICTADLIKNGPYEFVKDRNGIMTFLMILATFAVIALEDLGSALAICGGCFAMFIVAGLSKRWILGVIGAGIGVVAIYCIMEPYRIQRLLGFINQTDADAASGSAYQLVQSLYAFGSGGLFGVGLGNSGQKLLYLPGMHTDFIYSVIGEEFGIVGALLVLGLFMAFAWRGFWLATRIEDTFKSYLAFGETAIITVQALINMAVAVGVCPVTGITLPLISYGGTSLVITLTIIGILLNMSRYADKTKKRRVPKKTTKE
ncbi:MAG: putative lipid II flippase FtsW [Peptococcaceae bacterium]|nr:putative lipid II flippase FtsW [Peptococcaceae bacterium]